MTLHSHDRNNLRNNVIFCCLQILIYFILLNKIYLLLCLESLFCTSRNIIIAGDLNCPNINWIDTIEHGDGAQNIIIDFISNHGCSLYVTEPVRLVILLYVIITNCALILRSVYVGDPFANSHYCSVSLHIHLTINIQPSQPSVPALIYNSPSLIGWLLRAFIMQRPGLNSIVLAWLPILSGWLWTDLASSSW